MKKRNLHIIMLLVGSLSVPGLVTWIACYRRNLHLMKWKPLYMHIYIVLCLFACIILAVVILDILIRRRKKSSRRSGIYSDILVISGIVLTVGFFLFLTPYKHISDKEPELILVDQQGSMGFPDISLVWYTLKPQKDTLSYGKDPMQLTTTVSEEHAVKHHGLVMDGLVPGETYYYSRGTEDTVESFTYMPQHDGGLRLAISSDAHIGASDNDVEATQRILEEITTPSEEYALFFNLGDVVEMGNDDADYTQAISLFSPYTTKIPLCLIPGNHDVWFGGINFWKAYYYPESLPSQSSGNQLFHRYDFGKDVHIFTLDLEWGPESYTAVQRKWFEQQLSSLDPDDLIIIMNHAFYFASSTEYDQKPWYDNQEMIDTFHQSFIAHGVDFVFTGHDHQLEHIEADGIHYLIVGALGGCKDKIPTYISKDSRYRNFVDSGFADLTIFDDSVTLTLRDTDGNPLYSLSEPR